MKNIKKKKILSSQIKYLLILIISVFMIGIVSFLVFSDIKKNSAVRTNINNSAIKYKIKSNFLNSDPNGIINSIFINTTPDKISTIYVGGSNLIDSKKIKSAMVESTNNGKTWTSDLYFANPTKGTDIKIPIIYKIMTDFYTIKEDTGDSIVVTGKYLKSKSVDKNGNSTEAGQIAYKRVYDGKTGTIVNTLNLSSSWNDLSGLDFDSSTNSGVVGYSQKVMTASTIKYISSQYDTQDHIFIVTNDENIDVNNIKNIPYVGGDINKTIHPGVYKFSVYDLYIKNNSSAETPTSGDFLTVLSSFLNPASIYGTVMTKLDPSQDIVSKTNTFNAEKTSFNFISGIPLATGISSRNKNDSNVDSDNICFIVENQHYDKSDDVSKTNPANSQSFDNPIFIKYIITKLSARYIGINKELTGSIDTENFLIKSIAINPLNPSDDEIYDSNFLIFAGEKNNASYMISPVLLASSLKPIERPFPPLLSSSTTKNLDTSFISQVISFSLFNVKQDVNKPNVNEAISPLVIFGKNMKSSNNNIAIPDSKYTFINNEQNLTNQGLLLANIHYITTFDSKTQQNILTSSIFYSESPQYKSASEVYFVDNSINYSEQTIPSLSPKYLFSTSTYNTDNIFGSVGDLSTYGIVQGTIGKDDYNFINTSIHPNKKNKAISVTNIVVPVVAVCVVILISLLIIILFLIKLANKKSRSNAPKKLTFLKFTRRNKQ